MTDDKMTDDARVSLLARHDTSLRLSVTKVFRFAAHHRLPRHDGKCARDHGHNYRVEVTASGALIDDATRADDGMVIDFGELKRAVMLLVDAYLDHYSLNDVLENPTAERLAVWLLLYLPHYVSRIVVWETDDSFATVERDANRTSIH